MTQKILVVDDEQSICDLLVYNLRKNGYETVVATDGDTALQTAAQTHPDCILLDLMIPEVDGLEVCRELRKTSKVPIIMVTARGEEIDRVVGLEMGADDYLCKPFSVRELLARIKAVLRRVQTDEPYQKKEKLLRCKGFVLDAERRQAKLADTVLELTRLEFDLLYHLLEQQGRVVTRERLLELVWGYDFTGDTRAVDSAIKRLRLKLRTLSSDSDCIEAVRGIGYRSVD